MSVNSTREIRHESQESSSKPIPRAILVWSIGTGSDSLVLSISEDAYANGDNKSDAAGDARFTVLVDGKQLAGIFTAQASHAAGGHLNIAPIMRPRQRRTGAPSASTTTYSISSSPPTVRLRIISQRYV